MKDIDWDVAPKGSEKYNTTNGLFYRGGRPNLQVWFNGGWEESTLLPQNELFIRRPALTVADLKLESPALHLQWCGRLERKSPWPESGLPPIGTEREAKNALTDTWRKVKVIDHQGSVNSAVCREIATDKLWWSDSFRPVKTAEEIAAEERWKACLAVYKAIEDLYGEDVADKCEDILKAAESRKQATP